MSGRPTISYHFRHLLMSVTLLWALMLNGQEVVAYTYDNAPKQTASKLASAPGAERKTVVKQKVSLEATTSFVVLNLEQQALEPAPLPSFAAPADEVVPAYAARAPGKGFVARLFPITIQPNAP
ncbi:RNA methyltransferase [Pontibacter ruber]|uniref:RNA methyltransferase n=1 Tax=Pontibacter ruber TaxID=1343895 RepID=A0ABW5CUI6_9BACT|nr:RNA methyltransferase [Pontibacter ruber]